LWTFAVAVTEGSAPTPDIRQGVNKSLALPFRQGHSPRLDSVCVFIKRDDRASISASGLPGLTAYRRSPKIHLRGAQSDLHPIDQRKVFLRISQEATLYITLRYLRQKSLNGFALGFDGLSASLLVKKFLRCDLSNVFQICSSTAFALA